MSSKSVGALCAVALVAAGAAPSTPLATRIDGYLRPLVAAREFQGAVLVARNGRALFAHGYGYADRETRRLNTPDTRFRLVLATELFDRIAVLQLRDGGKLALDDSVCRWIASCPPSWRPITIQALLDHRSGLADVHPLSGRPRLPTIAAAVDWLSRRPVRPTRRDSSPAATIVLARVIERASGEPWFAYLRSHILRPARMTVTGAAAWSPDSRLITYSRRARRPRRRPRPRMQARRRCGSGARVLGGGAYQAPRFTPDGTQVAFNLGLGCRVRVVAIAGGSARTLPFEACAPVLAALTDRSS